MLASPDIFKTMLGQGEAHNIVLKDSELFANFFTVGLLQEVSWNDKGKTFRVCLPKVAWGRVAALLGSILRQNMLYFSTFKRGLNFQTKLEMCLYTLLLP